ncbi:MAG: hypothetical protein RI100_03285 [Nitrosarchaeum sp.]|jgi:hypothetical protein|uniref:hypothetical protein n=1 Tax=Nitrosarchaeum sp. TaxID=2026886 RepID=UPI002DF7285E|nr:hypothetical protein [Nitrosarchaeum sp.]
MIIKIIVIVSILALGIFLITENNGVYSSSEVIDSVKEHANKLEEKTSESVETGIGFMKTVDETGGKIGTQINNAKESTKEISKNLSDFNPLNKDDSSKDIPPEDSPDQSPVVTGGPNNGDIQFNYDGSPIYENLSLSMIQQSNGDVLLEYVDATGNTKSANVIIRTNDATIFSGTFFTSNFKTIINDISKTTYHVDITVDHKDYGIVSSTFNSNNMDSKVDGVFQS